MGFSANTFTGGLPTQLGRFTGLIMDFKTGDNDLTGTVPTQLGKEVCVHGELVKTVQHVATAVYQYMPRLLPPEPQPTISSIGAF